jgi:hypothetical protein
MTEKKERGEKNPHRENRRSRERKNEARNTGKMIGNSSRSL